MKHLFALILGMMALVLSACTSTPLSDASNAVSPMPQSSVEAMTHTKELTPTEEPEPVQEDELAPRVITSEHTDYEEFYFRLSDGYAVQCIESLTGLSCDWENKATTPKVPLSN